MTIDAIHHEPTDAGPGDPVLPVPRAGESAGDPVPRRSGDVAEDAGRPWSGRAREARRRLEPERAVIPGPRTPGGVDVPPPFGRGPAAPPADLVRETDALVVRCTAVEDAPDEPAHHALLRVAALLAHGVPDHGWSAAAGLDTDALAGAAELAQGLHADAAALLERLDAADRPSPAVVVDALVMSLRVARMVAELEVFARARS